MLNKYCVSVSWDDNVRNDDDIGEDAVHDIRNPSPLPPCDFSLRHYF